MNDKTQENLRELIGRFYPADQADQVAEDIARGQEMLGRFDAPLPRPEFLAQVKRQVAAEVRAWRRHQVRHFVYKAIAASAAVAIIAGIAAKSLRKPAGPVEERFIAELLPTAIWESDDLTADDLNLATFSTEVDRLEREVQRVLLGENDSPERDVDEYETEVMELRSEPWKG